MKSPATRTTGPGSRSGLNGRVLMTFATVLFGLSVRASSPAAGLAVGLATMLCGAAFWLDRPAATPTFPSDPDQQELRLLVSVLIFSLLGVLWWAPSWIGPSSESLERIPGVVWGLLAVWLFRTRKRDRARPIFVAITVVTLAVTAVAGVIHVRSAEGVGVDVYLLHQSAADAIAAGQNPYSDVVQVPNGAPTASSGDTIVGYPYPPLAAVAYSLGKWSFGDSRYSGLAAWLVVLGMIGVSGTRRGNRDRLYVMLLLASIPGWPLVLRAGWTEPLTLAFLAAAFLAWRRPNGSGAALGLGLASKQYFVVTAPLLLLHREGNWLRRLLVAGTVIVVTLGPILLLDPASFWRSAVDFHTSTPLRTDSVNIVGALTYLGLPWAPPRWLGPALGLVIATVAGKLSRTRESFFMGTALALAVSFLVASQALANYWFLITGLCALVLSSSASNQAEREVAGSAGNAGLDAISGRTP